MGEDDEFMVLIEHTHTLYNYEENIKSSLRIYVSIWGFNRHQDSCTIYMRCFSYYDRVQHNTKHKKVRVASAEVPDIQSRERDSL